MCVRDIKIELVHVYGYVLSFVKRAYFDDDGVWTSDDWGVAGKPRSQKVLMHANPPRPSDTDTAHKYLKDLPDGRRVLEIPYKYLKDLPEGRRVRCRASLRLRWEKVTPVLDRLAEDLTWRPGGRRGEHACGTRTLTVDELRDLVG